MNKNNFKEEVQCAVVGIGFRIPNNNSESQNSPRELWDNLINSYDGVVSTISRWSDNYHSLGEITNGMAGLLSLDELKSFDPLFFGVNPSECKTIDPQQRLLLKCTYESLEDAMIEPWSIRGSNTPVFIGNTTCDYLTVNRGELKSNVFGTISHSISNRISYCFDLRGPSMTIDTACSSSLNSVYLGYKSIIDGSSSMAIVGGSNLLIDPYYYEAFGKVNISSKIGRCMTFDAEADGFVRAECVGVVVLKNLKQAVADGNKIYCKIDGGFSNFDGIGLQDKLNFYSPSPISQAQNIKQALLSTNGRVNPGDIDFVETHGTGTPTGDPIETKGMSMVFKRNHSADNPLLIGSFKSNIGHAEAASGIASLIKCCLMFKNQCFAPNINFNTPNPAIKFEKWNLKVITHPIPFNKNKSTSMVVNNFGATGSNCCLVLSQFKYTTDDGTNKLSQLNPKRKYLIPFSANSTNSLTKYQTMVLKNSDEWGPNGIEFKEFVRSQINKSLSHCQRMVMIASDWRDFNDKEKQIKFQTSHSKTSNITIARNSPITVFVFCGQGSQYNTMALQLYNNEPIFKKSMDYLDGKLLKYYRFSIIDKLRSVDKNDTFLIHDPFLAQPSTVMVQISLFELYKQWGISPSFIIGHSLGEITSAYCSGMVDIDTLCYLVYHRSILQSKTNGTGKMLSINIGPDDYNRKYSSGYPTIEIACYNSSSSIVVAGNENELIRLANELKENNEFNTMLGSLSAFHTSSQLMIHDEVLALDITGGKPTTPTWSTVTSHLHDHTSRPFDSQYVFDNIVRPVLFSQSISNLYKHIKDNQLGSNVVFIEIAPHPTLSFYLKQMVPKQSEYFKKGECISIYSPLHKKKNDVQEIQQMISQLYCQDGYDGLNFKCQFDGGNVVQPKDNCDFELPLYQWDDKPYWVKDTIQSNLILNGPPISILGNSLKDTSPFSKSYQTFIDIKKEPFQYLKGHLVNGQCYFPASGYIDNILKMYPSQDLFIESLDLKSPLILEDGVNICLQSNVYQTLDKSSLKAQFHFKDFKSNEWIQSASSNFKLLNHGDEDTVSGKLNVDELLSKCNRTTVYGEEFYPWVKSKFGLDYQGIFHNTLKCHIGVNCTLAEVSLELPMNFHDKESFFNSSILDVCVQNITLNIKEELQVVLGKIQGLKYYSSNIPQDRNQHSTIYVYSTYKQRIGKSFHSSIVIMLLDGTALVEIDDVVLTSTSSSIRDPLVIEHSKDFIYTPYLQSKDSLIDTPSTFKSVYQQPELSLTDIKDPVDKYHRLISSLLFNHVANRNSEFTIEMINNSTIEYLNQTYCFDSKHSRLFNFVFKLIKQFGNDPSAGNEQWNETTIVDILPKSTKIIAKMLFPLVDEDPNVDTPQSLFEGGLLDGFYAMDNIQSGNNLISGIIKQILKPLVSEKMIFRILEFGGGTCSLSILVLDKINSLLLEYPDYQIDIEYTWSDISSSFIPSAKSKLSSICNNNKNVNIIYSSLDLDEPLIEKQQLKPSYYDLVIMSNVLHVVKDLKYALCQIQSILAPNGQMIILEPSIRSYINHGVVGAFSQWWAFEDTDIRKDCCCMSQTSWNSLLVDCNFKNDILMSQDFDYTPFVIQCQKPSLLNQQQQQTTLFNHQNDHVIIFGVENKQLVDFIKSSGQIKFTTISTVSEFNELVRSSMVTDNSIIYFLKSIERLKQDEFKSITWEYIQINKTLFELNSKCKHVLVTVDSLSTNYLASSLIGCARYFDEFPQLQLFTLDFDGVSFSNTNLVVECLHKLPNKQFNCQIEYFIRNEKVYFERYKKELGCSNQSIQSFKSDSFHKTSDLDSLYVHIDSNLETHLKSKPTKLNPNDVQVETKSSGINYKDYDIYSRVKGNDLVDQLATDFSGLITRVGSKSSEFKIGDRVYGIASGTLSSSITIDSQFVHHIPNNINYTVAASIPERFTTSYHCLFNVGNLRDGESILIHSASGGIGLSCLELLKSKGHKSPIFVTVGSDEKKQYILDTYGDMITGIYSSRDKDYCKQIKIKLQQVNIDNGDLDGNEGVDLILNTLSNGFTVTNLNCLNGQGRIVDLSFNPHHVHNDKFHNVSYHYVNSTLINKSTKKSLLKRISGLIESGQLNYKIPITEFSISNIKESLEFLNQSVHIGKIVINHDVDILDKLVVDNGEQVESLLKSNYQIDKNNLGKTILVTGQTGIVLKVLQWIIRYSPTVENIIILTRSSLKWELELLINSNKSKINFIFKNVDVGNTEQIENVLDEIMNGNPSLKNNVDSIFHYGFTPISKNIKDIDYDCLNVSHGAKTMGAINLHNQSIARGWKMVNFIMASSIAAVTGSMNDQCSYASSCCVLDSLSRYRKSIGLPSGCINYGPVGDTGYITRHKSTEVKLKSQGLYLMNSNNFLGALDLQIQNQTLSTSLVVCRFNFPVFKNYVQTIHQKFDYHYNSINSSGTIQIMNEEGSDSNETLETSKKQKFINKVSDFLSIDPLKLNTDIKLLNYGSDSLLNVLLKNWVDKEFLPNLITLQQIQSNTISKIYQIITDNLEKKKKEFEDRKSIKESNKEPSSSLGKEQQNKITTVTVGKEYWEKEIIFDINLSLSTNRTGTNNQHENGSSDKIILLSNSNGFLGTYLLYQLIKRVECKIVYCLLKSKVNSINEIDQIIKCLKHHRLYDQLTGDEISKINVVFGDFNKLNMGLKDQHEYNNIVSKVNIIIVNPDSTINTSAQYTHYINDVKEVKEIIKFSLCNKERVVPIIYVSSWFVNIGRNYESEDLETLTPLDKIEQLPNGSTQSKIIIEYLLQQASQKYNLHCTVLRSPLIFSNEETGIGNENDFLQLFLQSCVDISCFPSIDSFYLSVPICWLSKTICNYITTPNLIASEQSFNIYNLIGKELKSSQVNSVLQDNFDCKEVDYNVWFNLIQSSKSKSCIQLVPIQNEFSKFRPNSNSTFSFSNKTKSLLQSLENNNTNNNNRNNTTNDNCIITNQMIINHILKHIK